jgi:hypothetical protein
MSDFAHQLVRKSVLGGQSTNRSATAWRDNSIMLLQCYPEQACGRSEGGDE